MKIAILSMQKVYNYGSVLQAYSLKKIIEEITGEEAEFLNPSVEDSIATNMKVKDKNDYEANKYIDNKLKYFVKKLINKLEFKKLNKKIEIFQKDELKLNDNNINKMYDLVVEGSDEVFKCTKRVYLNLYGRVKNTKKLITYAASCGSANINGLTPELISILRKEMKKFNAMSVRDKNTEEYIGELYDGNIERNLDPVLVGNLSNREHKNVKLKNYMVVYAYGDRIRTKEEIQAIKSYAKKYKLKTIAIGAPQYWCDKFITVSPFEALDYFYHAKCVVTDTFHGTIFSIINKCKFATILRVTNQNKLGDLLKQLNLDDHIVSKMDNLENILNLEVDYNKVEATINKEKIKTKKYLSKYCKDKS